MKKYAIAMLFTVAVLAATARAAGETFDIWEIRVLGNSVLTTEDIEQAVYPQLGPGKSLEAVEETRVKLEALYRDRGFGTVFVDIPEQDVNEGVVRLHVTEGKLDRVRISGARYFSNHRILAALPALAQGGVMRLPELQAQLADVNRASRDRQVTPVLKAGRTPGTVDVDLKVKDDLPVHGSVEINDRYTTDTTRTRASVNLSYDNLFQRQHSLSLQYQTAPENLKDARVVAATYVIPMRDSGNIFAIYGVDTNSEVATVGTLSVLGAGRIYGARYIIPLSRSAGYSQSLTLGADYKDFAEDVKLTSDTGLKTPIQYLNWTVQYGGELRDERTSTGFNLGFNFGLRGVGNSPEEFETKRLFGKANYAYLKLDAQHERPFLLGTRLYARAAVQFTIEPLISNEQFAIGGADSVRGYLESELLGDSGFSGSLELRSPAFSIHSGSVDTKVVAYSFFDAGVVSVVRPLGQAARSDLSSWGAGIRLIDVSGLEAGLDWAYPLVPGSHVSVGDSRIHFKVRYGF